MPRKVLITGATGDTGRPAAREAIALGLDYPVAPGLITAAVNFAQAARKAGTKAVLNLSQHSQNRDSTSNSCRDTYIAEQVFNWSGVRSSF